VQGQRRARRCEKAAWFPLPFLSPSPRYRMTDSGPGTPPCFPMKLGAVMEAFLDRRSGTVSKGRWRTTTSIAPESGKCGNTSGGAHSAANGAPAHPSRLSAPRTSKAQGPGQYRRKQVDVICSAMSTNGATFELFSRRMVVHFLPRTCSVGTILSSHPPIVFKIVARRSLLCNFSDSQIVRRVCHSHVWPCLAPVACPDDSVRAKRYPCTY